MDDSENDSFLLFESILVLCSVSCPAIQRKKWMIVKMIVSYWMNDNGSLAGDGDGGNQLPESVQVTAGSIRLAVPGDCLAEKHEC